MDLRTRSKPNRRRATTVSIGGGGGGGGGVDLISGLSDDLLLHILDLVPDARDVVRTHALSRRWRGLWKGVAALRFDIDSRRRSDPAAIRRYIAFVNGALALRATAQQPASFEDLAICLDISQQETGQLVPVSVEAAQGWIRYAVQHEVKSFVLKLRLPLRWLYSIDPYDNHIQYPTISLDDEIGSYAKMKTMHLALSGTQLRLPPSTVAFPSLTDLSLDHIRVPTHGVYLLSRLLSSACCPRLHKLRLCQLSFELSNSKEVTLPIESDTLLELSLESMFDMHFVEIRTPSLQVLLMDHLFDLKGFTLSAPRLENLRFWIRQLLRIDVHSQLSSVGTLNIQMFSHGQFGDQDRNNGPIHLLQRCRLTRCLEVSFEIPKTGYQTIDLMTGRIPLLPYVTHLTVLIKLQERHSSGPGIARLLAQCSNVKYLSLQLRYIVTKKNRSELDLSCDNNSCHWKSYGFSLAHLQKVKFKKLMGTDCEFQFIRFILTMATGIQKVTVSFDPLYWPEGRKHAFKLMAPLYGGLWTRCEYDKLTYKWRRRL